MRTQDQGVEEEVGEEANAECLWTAWPRFHFFYIVHNVKNLKANADGLWETWPQVYRSVSLFVSWNDISTTDKHVPSHPRSPY
jgi:hypothetical protein